MDMVPNTFPSLFIGYSVIWGLVAALVWSSFRRVRHLERELERLKEQIGNSNRSA
ncbi:MAG: CcmD family protein [Bdellovibrionota bacterium]|nr:MAG: CcmD family protein [Bdellovibrionota bacterium]